MKNVNWLEIAKKLILWLSMALAGAGGGALVSSSPVPECPCCKGGE